MSEATLAAAVLVDELIRCAVREAVLAPGSRNAPLGYALLEAEEAGRLRLHVRIDERSAAFLALGLAKASGRPVVVCCTSGTAPANFHPAVLEAHFSGVPVVALTADRPPELRGAGANQTVAQDNLYRDALRYYAEVSSPAGASQTSYWRSVVDRALMAAMGVATGDPGPVQLNVPLREPLVPDPAERVTDGRAGGAAWTAPRAAEPVSPPVDLSVGRTIVVAGDGPPELGRRARRLAEAAGWPLFAEPSSGARGGPNSITSYGWLLGVPELIERLAPQRVLVVGRPTLSRGVQALLARPGVAVEVRAAGPRWADPGRVADRVAVGLPSEPAGRPSEPVGLPSEPVGLSSEPVGLPSEPVGPPSEPVG
ncbi:MAG: 2-succinyl-5-enolpyruvyl-6-hydroxy-3-cyclohexene-1-carboxylic-acid synthase, partial [Mycobacteriales bacterium]